MQPFNLVATLRVSEVPLALQRFGTKTVVTWPTSIPSWMFGRHPELLVIIFLRDLQGLQIGDQGVQLVGGQTLRQLVAKSFQDISERSGPCVVQQSRLSLADT
jgi:hypothetical protein